MTDTGFLIPLKAPYNSLILAATNLAVFLYCDLSTPFSISVFQCGLIDLDKQSALSSNLMKNNNSDYNATEEELLAIYTSHYIANRFGADKNSFYKWYLANDNGEAENSDDFRKVFINSQKGACMILEDRYGYNLQLTELKKKLEVMFGGLAEEK